MHIYEAYCPKCHKQEFFRYKHDAMCFIRPHLRCYSWDTRVGYLSRHDAPAKTWLEALLYWLNNETGPFQDEGVPIYPPSVVRNYQEELRKDTLRRLRSA